jgi:prepilin-type N-terminal cleavage/methylation domain-containing protein
MYDPGIDSSQYGMTLIEILIVLGLMTILGSLTLCVSFGTYRDSSYHTDRAQLISALQHARAESIDDICDGAYCVSGMPHGVFIQSDAYVIFQGANYTSRDPAIDAVIDANPAITHSGLSEVVFATSSGDVSTTGTIVLTDMSGHASTTTIGGDGQVTWSN